MLFPFQDQDIPDPLMIQFDSGRQACGASADDDHIYLSHQSHLPSSNEARSAI